MSASSGGGGAADDHNHMDGGGGGGGGGGGAPLVVKGGLRRGKWTSEEIEYASLVIEHFNRGRVTCAAFTRLSSGRRHGYSGQPVKQCAVSPAPPRRLLSLPEGSTLRVHLAERLAYVYVPVSTSTWPTPR